MQTWPTRWYMTSPFLPCPPTNSKWTLKQNTTFRNNENRNFKTVFFPLLLQPFPKGSSILKNFCNSQSVLVSPIWCKKSLHKSLRPLMYLYNLNWLKLWTAWNCTCCRYRAPNLQFLPSLYFSAKANSQ